MKTSVLITGIAGSGKSTLSKKLHEVGYVSYEIETISGLFHTVTKDTNEPFLGYDEHDPENVRRAKWVCNVEKLKELISKEPSELAFYCGTSSNIEETIDLFDRAFVLSASPEVTRQRLTNRTSHDFGKTEEVQDWLLSWKANWEKYMQDRGAVIVASDKSVEDTAEEILALMRN